MTIISSGTSGSYQPGYETTAKNILAFITSSGLKPGDRLPTEQSLGEHLGVSRAMVREAVKLLTASGHVRTRRGSGIYVSEKQPMGSFAMMNFLMPVDPEHIRLLFDFRCMQEMLTVRLAIQHITLPELRSLERNVLLNQQAAEAGKWEPFLESDDAFHLGIAEATHNPFLAETIATALRLQRQALKIATGGAPGSQVNAAQQHQVIFEAIKEGNPEAAVQAMKAHIETVLADYQYEVRRRLQFDDR